MRSLRDVSALLLKEFDRNVRTYLTDYVYGQPFVPCEIPLKATYREAMRDFDAFDAWRQLWDVPLRGAAVVFTEPVWHGLGGKNRVPERLISTAVAGVLDVLRPDKSRSQRYHRAVARLDAIAGDHAFELKLGLIDDWNVLWDGDDAELARVLGMVRWLLSHRPACCFIREIPVEGADTKWLQRSRGTVCALLGRVLGQKLSAGQFEQMWEFKQPNPVVSLRHADVFCPALPHELMAALPLEALGHRPRQVWVVENRQTGLALEAPDDVPIFLGLGKGAVLLAELDWIREVPVIYMGDLDVEGLEILSRLRAVIPNVRSVLMDAATLKRFRTLAVENPNRREVPERSVGLLDEREMALFRQLAAGRLRLEQERIPITLIGKAFAAAAEGGRPGRR